MSSLWTRRVSFDAWISVPLCFLIMVFFRKNEGNYLTKTIPKRKESHGTKLAILTHRASSHASLAGERRTSMRLKIPFKTKICKKTKLLCSSNGAFPPCFIKPRPRRGSRYKLSSVTFTRNMTKRRKYNDKLFKIQNSLFWFTDRSYSSNRKDEFMPVGFIFHYIIGCSRKEFPANMVL